MATANKPGIKTSEFWVALLIPPISGIIVGLFNHFGIPLPEETVYTSVATAITYIAGRSWQKAKA